MISHSIFNKVLIIIKGAGDLASGVAYRLKRAGFPLMMTELPAPSFVRRAVSYGEAVYSAEAIVEGITARRVENVGQALTLAYSEVIPILVDPLGTSVAALKPAVLIDAIMAKVNSGTNLSDAPLVVALGPGFIAGVDCHVVIETNRGHWLGRVIYPGGGPCNNGQAEPNTHTPGIIKGQADDRVLRAPTSGYITHQAQIGDQILPGQLIAIVNGQEIRAGFAGVLRGLVHPKVQVSPGFKIGDLDPRGEVSHCFTISDKSLAIAGGVLEAILASQVQNAN